MTAIARETERGPARIGTGVWREGLLPGAAAGIVGGLVFGATWFEFGTLRSVSSILRVSSPVLGFVIHMAIATVFGIIFGLLVWHQRPGTGETMFWGLAYGAFLWFVGALTLFPLLRGLPPSWTVATAQEQFPALLGHLLFGTFAGLSLVVFTYRRQSAGGTLRITGGALIRGGAAGLLAAWVCGLALGAVGALGDFADVMGADPPIGGWPLVLLVGLLAGIAFAFLYPKPVDRVGVGLIHGVVYGFLVWVLVAETILPITILGRLGWDVATVRQSFALFPACLLLGGVLALLYKLADKSVELAFAEDVGRWDGEGAGAQGLRALGRGLVAGLVGGALFTLVMVQIGVLGRVAELVGSSSTAVGIVLHLCISCVVGLSYGLMFQRQSHDLGSGLGWGVAYGFCWWVIGWLTLLPVFLGGAPLWSAEAVSLTIPALIGHLVYGAGLGITYFVLESRSDPWWVSPAEAEAGRLADLRAQVLSSAPALWSLIVLIAITIPVLLATP